MLSDEDGKTITIIKTLQTSLQMQVEGRGTRADKYLLSRDTPDGRPAECMDKCVYEREGDSSYYCFKKGGGMMSQCGTGDMEMITGTPPVRPQPTPSGQGN